MFKVLRNLCLKFIFYFQNFLFSKTWEVVRVPGNYIIYVSRWWFQIFFSFSSLPREMIQFDFRIFFKWVGEKPPTSSIIYPTKQGRGFPSLSNRDGRFAGSGEIGELWIAGQQVGLGYLRCQTPRLRRFLPPRFGGNDMVLGMAKQVYENKNGGNKMMLLPFIFFCDGSSLYPSKQARLDCYWCNLRRFANLCQKNLQQRLDRDVQVYICLESFSCFTCFFSKSVYIVYIQLPAPSNKGCQFTIL